MKIHLIGISGSAMGNLALMLRELGHEISGSDANVYPPMSDQLAAQNIPFARGFSADAITGKDLVVVGNAISRGNPELEAVLSSGAPYISLPQALERFVLAGRKTIVISGTHGKTTTTGLLAHILNACGVDAGYFVGGVFYDERPSYRLGTAPWFVIEGDEYDSAFFDKAAKFFHYKPTILLINAIEFDHGDIYPDLAAIQKAFRQLAFMVPQNGAIIANADYAPTREILAELAGKPFKPALHFFGLGRHSEKNKKFVKFARLASHASDQQFFPERFLANYPVFFPLDLEIPEKSAFCFPFIGRVETRLVGVHNALNILAATQVAQALGLDNGRVAAAIAQFPGMRRRQNFLAQTPFVLVDDFAHHPTAVRATIKAFRKLYPRREIWALFEPRSATAHLRVFEKDWPKAFRRADRTFLTQVYNPAKFAADRMIDMRKIAAKIEGGEFFADIAGLEERIRAELRATMRRSGPGPVVLLMSNGAFGGLGGRLRDFAREIGSEA